LKSHFEVAEERIAKKGLGGSPRRLLQKLLDREDDLFARRRSPGKEIRRQPARAEAARLIGSLPPEGLAYYEKEYGPAAAELLQAGPASNNEPVTLFKVHESLSLHPRRDRGDRVAGKPPSTTGPITVPPPSVFERLMQWTARGPLPTTNTLFKACPRFPGGPRTRAAQGKRFRTWKRGWSMTNS